jgi:hypothetical protein
VAESLAAKRTLASKNTLIRCGSIALQSDRTFLA